jgi:tetratricopeptide (TPR) repeat protein
MRSIVVLMVASLGIAACSRDPQQRAAAYMKRGDAYAAASRPEAALIEYRNAARLMPDSGVAYRKLGDAYKATGNDEDAFAAFARASALDPADTHSPLASVRLLLAAGQTAEAHTRAEAVLERHPDDVEAQTLVGISLVRLHRLEEAEVQLTAAGARDRTGEALTALGDAQLESGNHAEAEQAFRGAVRTAPGSSAARVALGQFLWSSGRLSEAEHELMSACAQGRDAELANRAMATFYLGTNRAPEAEPYLTRAAGLAPQTYHSSLALADFYASEGRYTEASKVLAPIADSAVDGAAARVRAIAIAYDTGARDAAHRDLDALLKHGATAEALALQARFFAAEGKPADALQAARAALEIDPHLPAAEYLAGTLELDRRHFAEAEDAFRGMLSDNRWAASAKVQLARVKLAMRQPDEAVELAASAIDGLPGALEPQLTRARAWIASGDAARGRGELRRLSAAFPQSAEPVIALASLDLDAGDIVHAKSQIDAGLRVNPQNVDLLVLAARAALASGDDAAAERTAGRAVAAAPASLDARLILAQVYAKRADLKRAQQVVEDLAAKQPSSASAQTAVGVLLQVQGRDDDARKWYARALDVDPKDGMAARNLAGILIADGSEVNAAVGLARTAVEERPDDAQAHGVLGWALFKSGRPGLAASELQRAQALNAADPLYRRQLAEVRRALESAPE